MHVGKKSQKREKSVMSVSLYGNVVFVVIELVMAIATGSQAVLLDAVYDGVEFFMLLPSVFLIVVCAESAFVLSELLLSPHPARSDAVIAAIKTAAAIFFLICVTSRVF